MTHRVYLRATSPKDVAILASCGVTSISLHYALCFQDGMDPLNLRDLGFDHILALPGDGTARPPSDRDAYADWLLLWHHQLDAYVVNHRTTHLIESGLNPTMAWMSHKGGYSKLRHLLAESPGTLAMGPIHSDTMVNMFLSQCNSHSVAPWAISWPGGGSTATKRFQRIETASWRDVLRTPSEGSLKSSGESRGRPNILNRHLKYGYTEIDLRRNPIAKATVSIHETLASFHLRSDQIASPATPTLDGHNPPAP